MMRDYLERLGFKFLSCAGGLEDGRLPARRNADRTLVDFIQWRCNGSSQLRLMMYQALHCDRKVKAWCRICNSDTQKFEQANSTTNEGLGIDIAMLLQSKAIRNMS